MDTGAATSSLHVDNLEEFEKDGALWVSFDIHPDYHDVQRVVRREAMQDHFVVDPSVEYILGHFVKG